MSVFIGTSGFNYKHWQGVFYRENLPQRRWLSFYSETFNTVEINVTFYRLPSAGTFTAWKKETKEDFCFAIKGSRYISHIKRLKDFEEPLNNFLENASSLLPKLKVILWQFPAGMKYEPKLLESFFRGLKASTPEGVRNAFEFRSNDFFVDQTYSLLSENNFALCIADSPIWPKREVITADFVYLRFHGSSSLYGSSYPNSALKEYAFKFQKWAKIGDVYAYFNNDYKGYAVKNALTLKELLGL